MSEISQPKPVAYVQWADEHKNPKEKGVSYGVETRGIPVWVRCKNDSLLYAWIRSLFYPGESPTQAQLLLVCPRCAQQLRVTGSYKTIQSESLSAPRSVPVQGNPNAVNVLRLTIKEPIKCPHCLQEYRLSENAIGKV